MRQAKIKSHHPIALLALLAVGVVVTGLLALVNVKPAWASQTFEPAQNSPFTVGFTPTTVTNADFDDDGEMDLAAQNAGSNTVSVLLGNGDGTFRAKQDHALGEGSHPSSVIGTDLNDDGKADLAVSNQSSGSVSVFLGKGDGTFQDRLDFVVGGLPSSVTSADLNNDDHADLALASFGSNTVAVLLGQDSNGDGKSDGFHGARHYKIDPRTPCSGGTGDPCLDRIMASPNQVIAADFNSDGKADLATANIGGCFTNDGGISVLLGNGDGSFQNARVYSMGLPVCDQFFNQLFNVADSVTAADVNSDGKADLAATIQKSDVVSVLKGNGDGTFQTPQVFSVGSRPSAVTSADLDGDAKTDDLAVSNFGSDSVSVLFNNDNGGFQPSKSFPTGDGPIFVIGAALNDDNFADLAVANQNSNNVSVLLNTVPAPETTITRGPPDPDNSTSATFEFTSSVANSSFKCRVNGGVSSGSWGDCASAWNVGPLADAFYTFEVYAIDAAGNQDPTPARQSWTVDTVAPTVKSTSPAKQATDVARRANVSATFSEGVDVASISKSNFKLFKCASATSSTCTTQVSNVTVTLSTGGLKATLNPYGTSQTLLAKGTKYKAVVTTGAKDEAGNALANNYTWTFTTVS